MTSPDDILLTLKTLLSQVSDPVLRRILLLAAIGETGPFSFRLTQEFRGLGILHLLVLSGTQVQRLASSLRWVLLGLTRGREGLRWFVICGEGAALFAFGAAVGWTAPLARAVIMEVVSLLIPKLRRDLRFLASLVIHLAVFPSHVLSVSFHLSWLACLALSFAGEIGLKGVGRVVFVSCLAQACAAFLLGSAATTPVGLPWLILTNVVLGWIFDAWLMPVLGGMTAFSIFVAPLADLGVFMASSPVARVLAACPLEGMARVVLVAIRGFRYIGRA